MPPGTGDVALTVFQSLPVDGVIIVTSPQELVSMIVNKAVKMADMMNIPVLGLVENYSYYQCPDCGKKHAIFGESHIDQVAKEHNIPVLVRLPIDPAVAAACDAGKAETLPTEELAEAVKKDRIIHYLFKKICGTVSGTRRQTNKHRAARLGRLRIRGTQ